MSTSRVNAVPGRDHAPASDLPKVPHVALAFWLVKVLTTGMGEAMSDAIAAFWAPLAAATVLAGLVGFVLLFRAQLRATAYHPVRYWATVALIAVYGTMAADVAHLAGIPLALTTLAGIVAVGVVLWLWRRSEGSISVHSITTRRREWFYWTTVAATFALGTAAGDLTAAGFHLGYRDSAFLFAGLMALVALAWRFARLSPVVTFWAAYVLTRPLGASIADWLGKPRTGDADGRGLGVGDLTVSLVALAVLAVVLVWLQRTRHDAPRPTDTAH